MHSLCYDLNIPHISSQTRHCWCCSGSALLSSWEASSSLAAWQWLHLHQAPCHRRLPLLHHGLCMHKEFKQKDENLNSAAWTIYKFCRKKPESWHYSTNVVNKNPTGSAETHPLQVWFQHPDHPAPCRHQHEQHPPSQHRSLYWHPECQLPPLGWGNVTIKTC